MGFYKRYLMCLLIFFTMITASSSCFFEEGDWQYAPKVTDLYTDVSESDWFAEPVQQAYELGLMKGTKKTKFEPHAGMTKAMFVQALYVISGQPPVEANAWAPYTDVSPDDPYYDAVRWLYTNYMKAGNTEDYFDPSAVVTREYVVRLLYAFSGEPPVESGDLSEYADKDVVDPWAQKAYVWALQNKITSGSKKNGRSYLKPRDDLSRADAASVLVAFFIYSVQNEKAGNVTIPEEIPIQKSAIPSGVKVPILMYHEVSDAVQGSLDYLFVSTGSMRSQLQWLKDNGYQTIHFSDLTRLSEFRKPVILTFDDGYEGNYTNLYPLLKEFNMKATIFVVTDEVGLKDKMTAEQLREISDSGLVSVQSHTKSHKRLNTLTDLQLIEECRESKMAIRRITGISPYVISYPEGRYNSQSIAAVSSYYDFGILDRHGPWKTSQQTFYYVPRTVIPRSFTIKQFAAAVTN